jgi:hypothetical protein
MEHRASDNSIFLLLLSFVTSGIVAGRTIVYCRRCARIRNTDFRSHPDWGLVFIHCVGRLLSTRTNRVSGVRIGGLPPHLSQRV